MYKRQIFTNYENVRETMRAKLPFGVAQIGKAFRNEISPRDFIFRVRELEQMEMQYFIRPTDQDKSYEEWKDFAWKFLTERLGIKEESLQWHEHNEDERAHYAKVAHDIYFKYPQGFKELWGTHNRTDYDLSAHQKVSGKELTYFDDESRERFIPYVIELSLIHIFCRFCLSITRWCGYLRGTNDSCSRKYGGSCGS